MLSDINVINSAGIKIENSLLILGFKFNADLSNIRENIDTAILKIKSFGKNVLEFFR